MMSKSETCRHASSLLLMLAATVCMVIRSPGQTLGQQKLSRPIKSNDVVALHDTVRSFPSTTIGGGAVPPDFVLPYVALVLKPPTRQQAQVDRLLHQQQKPTSPN